MLPRSSTMFSVKHLDHIDSPQKTQNQTKISSTYPISLPWQMFLNTFNAYSSGIPPVFLDLLFTSPSRNYHAIQNCTSPEVLNGNVWQHISLHIIFSMPMFTTFQSSISRCLDACMQGSMPLSGYSEAYGYLMEYIEMFFNILLCIPI